MRKTGITLFSGLGGIELGMPEIQWLYAVEADPKIAGHHANPEQTMIVAKVQDVDFSAMPHVDYLHASPVCKSFSKANVCSNKDYEEDLSAAEAICTAIRHIKPKVFTLENVPAYSKFIGYMFILSQLTKMGYHVDAKILNAADYGVPQNRMRLMLVAKRYQMVSIQQSHSYVHGGWYAAIKDLLPGLKPTNLNQTEQTHLSWETGCFLLDTSNQGRVNYGGKITRRSPQEPSMTITANSRGFMPKLVLVNTQQTSCSNGKRSLNIVQPNEAAFAVTASAYKSLPKVVNPNTIQVYRLNARCLARLQSIPDSWPLTTNNKLNCIMIGNAVPPLMARRVFLPHVLA